jgi:hypothetical protein
MKMSLLTIYGTKFSNCLDAGKTLLLLLPTVFFCSYLSCSLSFYLSISLCLYSSCLSVSPSLSISLCVLAGMEKYLQVNIQGC